MLSLVPGPIPARSILVVQPALANATTALANPLATHAPAKRHGDVPTSARELLCHAAPCHAMPCRGAAGDQRRGRRVFH